MAALPFVSVVMPVRNEDRYLARSLGSVLAQDYPSDRYEVIVVDGDSDDGTLAEIDRLTDGAPEPAVQVLHNPERIVPISLNLALEVAKGDYVVRMDGHAHPPSDYVRRCIEVLQETGHECVGGVIDTVGETPEARAVAAAQSSRFGVGNSTFRVGSPKPGPVDTVPFGAWPREVFDRIGGFDEELVRNQDDELLFRLTQAGGTVWFDPSIRCSYFSRADLRTLRRQYFQYGMYKVRVAQKRGGFASWRHVVPAAFVVGLAGSALLSLLRRQKRWLGVVAGSYVLANALATRSVARDHDVDPRVVAAAFATLHLAYGTGTIVGVWRFRDAWGVSASR